MYCISGGYSNLGARGKNFQKIGLHFPYFRPKIRVFSNTLNRSPFSVFFSQNHRPSLKIELRFFYFRRQLQVSSQNANFSSRTQNYFRRPHLGSRPIVCLRVTNFLSVLLSFQSVFLRIRLDNH